MKHEQNHLIIYFPAILIKVKRDWDSDLYWGGKKSATSIVAASYLCMAATKGPKVTEIFMLHSHRVLSPSTAVVRAIEV